MSELWTGCQTLGHTTLINKFSRLGKNEDEYNFHENRVMK